MALICFNSFTLNPPSSSSIFPLPTTTPVSRVNFGLPPSCFKGIRASTPFVVKRRKNAAFIASAAADSNGADGVTSLEEGEGKKESDAVVSVDKLPLESKVKEREEQRLKMKLAKKIRLRRKRLVQKRKLRKKGKWPPSKMKKLKNV